MYMPSGNFKSLFTNVAIIPSAKASTIGEARLAPNEENKSILLF
jgi:hypothetical protein